MKGRAADRGSVTVFLCLMSGVMLLLIVSLISVMRFRWEKTQIVRSANIAMQAEFSKFYRPLYDDYRMFYYIETDSELLETGINSYFIRNQQNMPKLLALTLSGTFVTDKKYAAENGAYNVRCQMTEAVKYALGEKVFDETAGKLMNNEDTIAGNDAVLEDAAGDINNIKEEAGIEAKVLELLKTVEGVSVSGGNIRCAAHFVKEGVPGEVKPVNAGVDSDIVWKKTKDKYIDIMKLPKTLKKIAEKGCSGSRAVFPLAEIKEWRKRICNIREITVRAHDITAEINSCIGEKYNGKMICDTFLFETYLSENIHILDKVLEFADTGQPLCKAEWESYMQKVEDVISFLDKYHIRELRFDYSTLNLVKQADPRKGVGRKVNGILNLLLDDDKNISKKNVPESDVYYSLMSEDEFDRTGVTTEEAKNSEKNGAYMFDDDADSLEQFVGDCRSAGLKPYDNKLDTVGMSLYIDMFFGCYLSDETHMEDSKALDYEKEYIVAGKSGDEQNLKKVAGDILKLRTGMSIIHILSDSEKRNKAYIAAVSIVGFTGMDAIVRIVQYSIIAAWAYEDACVDVAVLLAGKKVPYIKNNGAMNVNFSEMPLFNREFIKNKVVESNCVKGMDYNAYLNALLIAKKTEIKTYRIMDIIQYNIKKNYSRRFSFQDALYGAAVHIKCSEPFESSAAVSYSYK